MNKTTPPRIAGNGKNTIILCAAATALNMAGALAAAFFGIPLYLDTAGTIIAAALGGYLPGVVTGFATGMLSGLIDKWNAYYTIINILVAVCTVFMVKRKVFNNPVRAFLTAVPLLAAVTGVCGAALGWCVNGFAPGGKSAELTRIIGAGMNMSGFLPQLAAELLLGIADKAAVSAAAGAVIASLPKSVKNSVRSRGRWQAPLPPEIEEAVRKSRCRSISLRTRILLILTFATVLIVFVSTWISFVLFRNSTVNEHIKLAEGLSELAADAIDAEKIDEYLQKGELAEGYKETEQRLYKLKGSSPDVEYIYVYRIMEDGCHVVFDLDTAESEGSEPGEVVEFDESFSEYIPALLAGEEVEPIISNDSYGWLLTVYKPVYDSSGRCSCYAAVDISMELLSAYEYNFIARLIFLLMGFFALVLAAGLWIGENNITLPVNTMAYCAGAFAYNSDRVREESVERINELDIRTGDEIENLYKAFAKTTGDSMRYVADIQHKTETISKMQNGLILVLADMVESRDKNTGDHIRKTAAYVEVITREMKRLGYYGGQLTDEFVHNVVNAAPLHDIGKIQISDAILNKPGRLTDEEFEIMKKHTIYGSEIIERAIEMVSESGYLREAKNMAEYHHEKWNGTGYPHGISGEDIPLSARIMAVADVFDALVSRRSYKAPFPFEKALDIIRQDAGAHFDPLAAKAFLGAESEVREIAESFEE